MITGGVTAAQAVPTFLVALLLLDVFSYLARLGNLWLQPGYFPLTQSPGQWLSRMILISFGNLAADIWQAMLDPRVRIA